jgi:beta-glucosidase
MGYLSLHQLRQFGHSCPKRSYFAGCLLASLSMLLGCGDSSMQPEPTSESTQYEGADFWPKISSPVALEPQVESRIASILESMTLEEKVGQIIQAEIQYTTPEDVREFHLGSVLNGGGSLPNRNKHATPAEWLALADAYYDASMDTSDGGVGIPIIWGSDAVHGHNNVIGATVFPHNVGLGAARNPTLIREIGRATAREMRVTGIDWTFAPTVAVARDLRWGRAYESYSEDPAVVRAYAGELVLGLQGEPGTEEFLDQNHVVATVKHFVGDGGTERGDDQGDARVSEEELRDIHAQGYISALEAGVQTAMASFSSWNDEKLHGHRYLLTEVLKSRMGLDGILVGDWNGHGQLPGCNNASCPDAIIAGLDLFMAVEDWKDLYRNTLEQARAGIIPMSRLDDAVSRILRVKIRAGLFDKGRPSARGIAGDGDIIGSQAHRSIARRAVRESMVLLKNDGVLPIAPSSSVLVAGDGADNIAKQTGGWTITWQGTDNRNEDFPGATSIVDGISEAVAEAGGSVILSPEGSYEVKPDVAIVVFGEDPYAEFQGDLEMLEFEPRHKSSLTLLRKLRAEEIPVVSIFLTGRPLWVSPELNQSNAFVVAWLPGTEGEGVADLIVGDQSGEPRFDFTGTLPFSWPQTPLHKGQNPLFQVGYGLTYAESPSGPQVWIDEDVEGVAHDDGGDLVLYHGRPMAPFAVFLEGDRSEAQIMSGPFATHVSGQVSVRTADMKVQEDALKLNFTGTGKAGVFIGGGFNLDLSRFLEQGSIRFMAKVDEMPDGHLMLRVGEREHDIAPQLERIVGEGWQSIAIAMSCFADDSSDLQHINMPFRIGTAEALEIGIGNIEFHVEEIEQSCN